MKSLAESFSIEGWLFHIALGISFCFTLLHFFLPFSFQFTFTAFNLPKLPFGFRGELQGQQLPKEMKSNSIQNVNEAKGTANEEWHEK